MMTQIPAEKEPLRCGLLRLASIVLCFLELASPALTAEGFLSIPVPSQAIYPGAPIRDEQLVDRSFRASIARTEVHLDRGSVLGKSARRVLLPGRPIPTMALKESEPVSAGQSVAMIFQSGPIEITGRAVALQPGKLGELISVRNVDTGVVVRAVVQSDGSVRVGSE